MRLQVTYERDYESHLMNEIVRLIFHMNESHIDDSCPTQMNPSCHSEESVMSRICLSYVTHIAASQIGHLRRHHPGFHMNSCDTHENEYITRVDEHVTHVNESCHTHIPINGSEFTSLQPQSGTVMSTVQVSI